MRALPPVLVLALLAPALASGSAEEEGPRVRVRVRVEGAWAHVLEAEVTLPPTFGLVAANSGRAYVLEGRTPLAALVLAAEARGIALEVSDEYADFTVAAVAGEAWYLARWWDFRVGWVEPNYGAQQQWLAWGRPLRDGDEVLWYVDQAGMTPLRLAPLAGAGSAPCLQAAVVETLAVDLVHQPGQPWPDPVWRPAALARLDGSVHGPVLAGLGVGGGTPGPFWAEEQALPGSPLHHIRSPRAPACP